MKNKDPRVSSKSDVPSFCEATYVDIGEIKTGYSGEFLKIPSLGSCIGLVIYPKIDQISTRCAVMGHIMLSQSPEHHRELSIRRKSGERWGPAKYANKAIPVMISQMKKLGYQTKDLVAKMVGGAKMFNHAASTLRIGETNINFVKELLKSYDIPLEDFYTGGDIGMSAYFSVSDYLLVVTPTGGLPTVL